MARGSVPITDTRDPGAVQKALRAIELQLQQLQTDVDLLKANKPFIPLDGVGRAPDNAPVPTGITLTLNPDGSMSIELAWKLYIQGTRPATQLAVFVKRGPAPLTPPTKEDVSFTVPTTVEGTRFDSLPSNENFRFGIAAAREGPNGLIVGAIISPTANPDWADVSGGDPKFFGLSGNLCPNPDFETPNYLWVLSNTSGGVSTVSYPTTDAKFGTRCAELVVTTNGDCLLVSAEPDGSSHLGIPVEEEEVYAFAVWVKRVSGSGTIALRVRQFDSGGSGITSGTVGTSTSGSWTRITGEITLASGAAFVAVDLGVLNTGTGTYRFDGVQVVKGPVATIPDFDGAQLDHHPFYPDSDLAQAWLGSRLMAERDGIGSDVLMVEDTWVEVASVTVTIYPEASLTKVLLAATIAINVAVTTAGTFQLLWRVLKDGSVLHTSNQVGFDSIVGAGNYDVPIGVWMDETTDTGDVVYSLEFFKNDLGLAVNTINVKSGGQFSAFPWSN